VELLRISNNSTARPTGRRQPGRLTPAPDAQYLSLKVPFPLAGGRDSVYRCKVTEANCTAAADGSSKP